MIEATLPGIPLEIVAAVLENASFRTTWDRHQTSCSCHDDWGCPESHTNSIFHCVLHAPPFADRDFVNFVAYAKSEDGNAYMVVARDGEHPKYSSPGKNTVRANIFGNVCYVHRNEDDQASTSFVMISKQDIKMTYIPQWLMNYFVPSEL